MIRSLILLATIIGTTILFTALGIFTAFVAQNPYDTELVNRICSTAVLVGFTFLGIAATLIGVEAVRRSRRGHLRRI